MSNYPLNADEIRELLVARYNVDQRRKKKVTLPPMLQGLDLGVNPGMHPKVMDTLFSATFDKMAERLASGSKEITLLTDEDFSDMIPQMLPLFEELGDMINPDTRTATIEGLRSMFDGMKSMTIASPRSGETAYEVNWRWLNNVCQLADELEMPRMELLTYEDAGDALDELDRRQYTREEYRAHHARFSASLNKKQLIELAKDSVSKMFGDSPEAAHMNSAFAFAMPMLESMIDSMLQNMQATVDADVKRIYGEE
jgi:hypothetical protein